MDALREPTPYQDMLLAMDDLPCPNDINETVSAVADVVERVAQYLAEAEDSLARAKETSALVCGTKRRAATNSTASASAAFDPTKAKATDRNPKRRDTSHPMQYITKTAQGQQMQIKAADGEQAGLTSANGINAWKIATAMAPAHGTNPAGTGDGSATRATRASRRLEGYP
eukprot:jgi/Tetstr1/420288/TSEL_001037.t1